MSHAKTVVPPSLDSKLCSFDYFTHHFWSHHDPITVCDIFIQEALAIRRIFSLVDMITKAKFSYSPNDFKIRLFG